MDTQHWKVFERQTVDGKYRLKGLLGNGAFGGMFLADDRRKRYGKSNVES